MQLFDGAMIDFGRVIGLGSKVSQESSHVYGGCGELAVIEEDGIGTNGLAGNNDRIVATEVRTVAISPSWALY